MATDIKTLVVRAKGEGIRSTSTQLDGLTRSASGAGTSVGTMFKAFLGANLAQRALSQLTNVLKMAATESVKLAASFETTEVKFGVMLQSTEKARVLITQLREFAALTPLETEDIEQATKLLLGYGIAAVDIIPTLRRLGDAAGGQAMELINLSRAYGQVAAQGRAQMQDMYQFINAGVPIFRALGEVMGVPQEQIRDLVAQGKVGFAEVQAAVKRLTDEGSQFGGMMEKISQITEGKFSTMIDNLKLLAAAVGDYALDSLNDVMDFVIKASGLMTDALNLGMFKDFLALAGEIFRLLLTDTFSTENTEAIGRYVIEFLTAASTIAIQQILATWTEIWKIFPRMGERLGEDWWKYVINGIMKTMTGGRIPKPIKQLLGIEEWEGWKPFDVEDLDLGRMFGEEAIAAIGRNAEQGMETLKAVLAASGEALKGIGLEYEDVLLLIEQKYAEFEARVEAKKERLRKEQEGLLGSPTPPPTPAAQEDIEAMKKRVAAAKLLDHAYEDLEAEFDKLQSSENDLIAVKLLSAGATEEQVQQYLALLNILSRMQREEEEAAKKQQIINDLIEKTKDDLVNMLQTYSIDFLEGVGASIISGTDSIEESLKNIGIQIMNALPQLLFYAGVQLCAAGAWPVGLSLILASGIVAIGAGALNEATGSTGNAMGNVYGPGGKVHSFALGGIVRAPTWFSYAGGMGQMGEEGEEAIMPLKRMPSGRLGVEASRGGNTYLTVNNYTDGEVETREERHGDDRFIEITVGAYMKKVAANGTLDGVLGNRYGLKPRGIPVG